MARLKSATAAETQEARRVGLLAERAARKDSPACRHTRSIIPGRWHHSSESESESESESACSSTSGISQDFKI